MATYFRQLGPDHTPQLTDCLVRWHWSEGRFLDPRSTGREAARILADNHGWHIWMIEHQDAAVGYLAVNFRPGAAFEATRVNIAGLYVIPEHRNLGIGRQARRLVGDLGRCLGVQVYDFETESEAKHALALTRHGSVLRASIDTSLAGIRMTAAMAPKPEAMKSEARLMMQAIAVMPGKPGSVHLTIMPRPAVSDIAGGRGVLVKVLKVGVDGTDKEINAAEYGAAPEGCEFLVIGHESFGRVEAVGPNVTELAVGDYVVATVRRPGHSIYDVIGTNDMTTDDVYYERGINLRHGYLAEYYVDDVEFVVKIPQGLKEVGVLLEPTTVVEKGIAQAWEIQRRLRVWRPRKAAVMGAGTIGLLAAMALRIRGLDVTVFGLDHRPFLNSDLIEALGARYESTRDIPVLEGAARHGPFDLIFEATGYSPIVFESMQALNKNGVLVLSSVTGGDRMVTVPADKINLDFVLGNKVMVGTVNANREYFETGVKDLATCEAQYPGWLSRLLTHPVQGLENYAQLFEQLTTGKGAIKVYCRVAD